MTCMAGFPKVGSTEPFGAIEQSQWFREASLKSSNKS